MMSVVVGVVVGPVYGTPAGMVVRGTPSAVATNVVAVTVADRGATVVPTVVAVVPVLAGAALTVACLGGADVVVVGRGSVVDVTGAATPGAVLVVDGETAVAIVSGVDADVTAGAPPST